ncbi:MAG TPA: trypsin-like peptidase domain-containing protein [Candidatus Acidoferrum sp.]|nr:trypsin-like peptidase domain-containing protein [Candidatus Acidoferrum sp.]
MKRLVIAAWLLLVLSSPTRAGWKEGLAAYERGDYDTAFREFLPLAEHGDAHAQYNLGIMYDEGRGVRQDYSEAVKWYRSAAEYRSAVERGDAVAQFNLGFMYAKGHGVPTDAVEAVKWYRRAAEQGLSLAKFTLGVMYYYGRGVPRDDREAAEWYSKAAERSALSTSVVNHMFQGVVQDYGEAARWYRNAAEQGDAGAQLTLGFMYDKGYGVPQDDREAVNWYRRAAEEGDGYAQFTLGFMYYEGRGVPQDYSEAAKLFRRSAERGDAGAQFSLSVLYSNGQGVPRDFVQAYVWCILALSQTPPGKARDDTIKWRDVMLAERMTPEQIALAQDMARNWRPKTEQSTVPRVPPGYQLDEPTPSQEPRAFGEGDSEAFPPSKQMPPPTAATQSKEKDPELYATGTGFVVSKAGHVITNLHVVEDCKLVHTRRGGLQMGTVAVSAVDSDNDLALLLPQTGSSGLATFRQGREVRAGDSVVAVGFPLHGLLASSANVTTGTVSAVAGIRDDTRYLQITAPVQPGNSGGPLLDLSGNVVGVVVAKLDALKVAEATGDIPQNVNFAIKDSVVRNFLDAKGVEYETAASDRELAAAEIGERAVAFTVLVECWK